MMAGCGGSTSSSNAVTAMPTFSPGAGTYTTSQTVTISDTTSGAVLYCTIDGTMPTTSSSVCSNPTTVSKTEFLQAIAVAPGKSASAVASAGYVINLNAATTPAFSPTGGTYTGPQQVMISDSLSGANIYYTTDGTTPTTSSTLYTGAITISKSETLSAIAVATGYDNSAVASAAYTIQAVVATPTISSLSPTSVTAGGAAFTLTVNGTNFDSGSTVKWGSTALTTTYVNSTQLTAAVPASLITSSGSVVVSVVTSAGAYAYGAFAVNSALPSITSISPSSATAGGAAFTLTVNGTNFDSSAKVGWNGTALTTSYVSATQVTAAVPASLIASAGTASITVSTTAGTGGANTFTVQSGTPTITGINPSSVTAGGTAFTLTVNGTNFDSSAKVGCNGTVLTTSYVNANQVTATVPANLIASAGTASITVTTNVGVSSASSFAVQAAAPVISSISPTSATVGSTAFTLTVNGTNFDSSAKVSWNGAALTTTYVNATQVTASILANLVASAGTANISVTTSAGTSPVSTFTIQLGAPTITTINPTSVTVGGSAFTLTANGTNFDSSAVVKWNGSALATALVNSTQVTASASANLIASTGSASISVATTAGTSSTTSLAIQQAGVPTISTLDPASVTAGGSAFLLTVNGSGFDSNSVVKWNGTALTTIYVSSTELQAAISADSVASAGTVSVTVSGTKGTSAASSFLIKLGVPTITGFSPTSASSNDSTFTTLTVNGTNFDSSAVVNWNSTALTTNYVSATQVTAAVPASLIASPGTVSITVTTTAGTSAANSFAVNLGKPAISSTDPTSVTAGGSSFTLKVTGTNFDSSAKIKWNGTALTTTLVSATEVDANINSSLIATAGSATITVTNSAGTSSGSYTLTINTAAPSITDLTPSSGAVGDTVVIAGSNFGASQSKSIVTFNGTDATTIGWGDTSVSVMVPTGATSGKVVVTVNGAASNGVAFTVNVTSSKISGTVVSGPAGSGAPIINATVQLYGAGIAGYGSAGNSLGSTTTGNDGSFTVSYSCPVADAGDELYLVATGGSTTSGANNSGLALMTALGSCNASTFPISSVVVNEVSTVASAYALAQFSTNAASGSHGILVGTSTGNYIGLYSAMKTVNNLYNSTTGEARSITPSYAANGGTSGSNLNSSYVPQARIQTLANILNSCVGTNTGSCGTLFNAATPSVGSSPTDTLQAILNIARNPGSSVSNLFALQPSQTAFQPALNSAPTDWTIALTYTGGGMGAPTTSSGVYPPAVGSMAIDADGGIWMIGKGCSSGTQTFIARFDNQGNTLSPDATDANDYCGGLQPTLSGSAVLSPNYDFDYGIAIDSDGYVWVADAADTSHAVAKLDSNGNALDAYAPVGGVNVCLSVEAMVIDKNGYLWTGGSSHGSSCLGAISTADGSSVDDKVSDIYLNGTSSLAGHINSVVVDPSGVVWSVVGSDDGTTSQGTGMIFKSVKTSDTTISTTSISGTGNTFTFNIVTDSSGNLYSPSTTPGSITKTTAGAASFSPLSYLVPSGAAGVQALAVDGAGHLWGAAYSGVISSGVAVSVPSYLVEYDKNGNQLSPSSNSLGVYGYTGTGGGGETHSILADDTYLTPIAGTAVDNSGNLWVANGGLYDNTAQANELVEFIGLAVPVRTPIVAALKNGETGASPTVAGPVVTNLSETSGAVGDTVTINGIGFGTTKSLVTFNGFGATVSSWSDTSITVTVPTSATTGNVYVFASTGISSNGAAFTVR
jgi:hypothetical protein